MNRKNILIVSFFFQPYNVIGSVRVTSIAKYLQEQGYNVHIVTAHRSINTNLKIANIKNVHYVKWTFSDDFIKFSERYPNSKILKFFSRFFNKISVFSTNSIPEGGISIWGYLAYKRCEKIVKREKIELVYTSTGPVSSAIVGSRLSKRFGIKWIPEFRDLWCGNPYSKSSKFFKKINLHIENRIIKEACHIITCTEGFKEQLKKLHPEKEVSVIYNGFDFTNVNSYNVQTPKIVISHMGYLYRNKRDPSVLFEALSILKDEGIVSDINFEVNFYGVSLDFVNESAINFGISDIVNTYPTVSRNESLKIQENSTILLLLAWNNPKDYSIPGKLFEYLGMMKPILGICYPGEIAKILKETGVGEVINDVNGMTIYLKKMMQISNQENFFYSKINLEKHNFYSRETQNKALNNLILKYIDTYD